MTQFTFWNANDTREHVTLAFDANGTIWHKSRETERSVAEEWHAIGAYSKRGKSFVFDACVPHLWVAATQLSRKGFKVYGGAIIRSANVTSRETDDMTDPDTLLGQPRKRSISVPNDVASGERGAVHFRVSGKRQGKVDVTQMRRTLLANRAARAK